MTVAQLITNADLTVPQIWAALVKVTDWRPLTPEQISGHQKKVERLLAAEGLAGEQIALVLTFGLMVALNIGADSIKENDA